MPKLILIIGIPGSGKSTFANLYKNTHREFRDANIWEADSYFIDPKTGVYDWKMEELGLAHKWCQEKTEQDMIDERNVIVSNTSLTPRERRPYIQLAKKYDYEIEVHTCNGNFKNIHGVPDDKIKQMKNKFVPFSEDEINF